MFNVIGLDLDGIVIDLVLVEGRRVGMWVRRV